MIHRICCSSSFIVCLDLVPFGYRVSDFYVVEIIIISIMHYYLSHTHLRNVGAMTKQQKKRKQKIIQIFKLLKMEMSYEMRGRRHQRLEMKHEKEREREREMRDENIHKTVFDTHERAK